MPTPLEPPRLADVEAAAARLAGTVLRTPLVPLPGPDVRPGIHLKLENLQPIGSFKLRGAGNAMRRAGVEALREGVYTASAGNMAQGVAWNAREMGVPCEVVVPEHAPATKLAAVERLGARILRVPFDEWWRVLQEHGHPDAHGRFFHPVSDPDVIAGNGTIGLEILEDLPEVDAVLVPFGGGGLSSGIATAVRALRPRTKIYACEVETAAPLRAALDAGEPTAVEYEPSFVDGIGGKRVLEEMWPLVRELIDDSIVVSLEEIAHALRLLVERNRVIVEGAGAAPVAAALSGRAGEGRIACVVSGGNVDFDVLARVVLGRSAE